MHNGPQGENLAIIIFYFNEAAWGKPRTDVECKLNCAFRRAAIIACHEHIHY